MDQNDELNFIEPEEMPKFLNDIAAKYFRLNPEIRFKLTQCSVYIHGMNKIKRENNEH